MLGRAIGAWGACRRGRVRLADGEFRDRDHLQSHQDLAGEGTGAWEAFFGSGTQARCAGGLPGKPVGSPRLALGLMAQRTCRAGSLQREGQAAKR